MLRASFDIGGTFTDFVVIDDLTGEITNGKIPTEPTRPALPVLKGLDRWVGDLGRLAFAVHGTTVGLNAFLERRGGRTLLAVTRGTRDVLSIARGHRIPMFEARWRKPTPLIPIEDIMEVEGRVSAEGDEVVPLNMAQVDAVVARLRDEAFDAVVIAFLFSYLNPRHEEQVAVALADAACGVPVWLSHQVAPQCESMNARPR